MYINFFLYFILIFFITLLLYNSIKNKKLFLDDNFTKPQSVHSYPIPSILGITFIFVILYFYFFGWNYEIFIIFLISSTVALIGFLEDINFNIHPKNRLFLQAAILMLFIVSNDIFVIKDFTFFNENNTNYISELINICISIILLLALINAINFIDGQNGLVLLYFIIIIIFYLISYQSNYLNILIILLVHLSVLLLFNFPLARCFLGDSGSYFLATFMGLLFILENNTNYSNDYSKWLIANLLAYPVAETSISIIRRIKNLKSPFFPDNFHLHSNIFKIINFKMNFKKYSNSLTTICILFFATVLLIPINYYDISGINLLYYFILQQLLFVIFYFIITAYLKILKI